MKKLVLSAMACVAMATGALAATIDVAQANFAQNRTLKGSNLYRFTGSITFTAAACTVPAEEDDPSAIFIRASLQVIPAGE